VTAVYPVHCVSYTHIGGPEANVHEDVIQPHPVPFQILHLPTT